MAWYGMMGHRNILVGQIREQLVRGDSSEVLGLLMKYPVVEDVTPIMDLADMLRRGVLNCGAHLGPPPMKTRSKFDKLVVAARLSPHRGSVNNKHGPNNFLPSSQAVQSHQAAWYLSNPILPVLNSSTLNNMGKK